MDYETVIEAQLDSMDLSGLEDIMGDAAAGGRYLRRYDS